MNEAETKPTNKEETVMKLPESKDPARHILGPGV